MFEYAIFLLALVLLFTGAWIPLAMLVLLGWLIWITTGGK